jgi:hypothetical protein
MIMRNNLFGWAGNVCNFPREITETALPHGIGDKAGQACRRSDALEKRRARIDRKAYAGAVGLYLAAARGFLGLAGASTDSVAEALRAGAAA